eukprot:TRINITY_DN16439_c0_g1_i1.p1 TRINITY_DN16439_c0_g1~~TRINITY_DN16439_c0_g1_i1.p1  ORF type:complete len:464 (-),score=58.21 TRINITY_DN16439_c0_g1_i1:85-1476(-)
MSPWLKGVLHLVALRIKSLKAQAEDWGLPLAEHWLELEASIPQSCWKKLRAHCPDAPANCGRYPASETHHVISGNTAKKMPCLTRISEDQHCETIHQPSTMQQQQQQQVTLKIFQHQQAQILLAGSSAGSIGSWGGGADDVESVSTLIKHAMEALHKPDADSMVRHVTQIVSLLASPMKRRMEDTQSATANLEGRQRTLNDKKQKDLRDALLRLLGAVGDQGLDLRDAGTLKLLKVPFERIRNLLQDADLERVAAREQWLVLAHVVGAHPLKLQRGSHEQQDRQQQNQLQQNQQQQEQDQEQTSEQIVYSSRRKIIFHRSTQGGIYEPNERIKQLPSVVLADAPIILTCSKCPQQLLSQWSWQKGGKVFVLKPWRRHPQCGGRYVAPNGIRTTNDIFNTLDLCQHELVRKDCRRCHGSGFCKHGRRRRACRECRASGLVGSWGGGYVGFQTANHIMSLVQSNK